MNTRHAQAWKPAEIRQLGKATDAETARRLGRTHRAVESKRISLGIASKNQKRRKWTAREVKLLGKMPDAKLADRLGTCRQTVLKERQRRRITAYSAKNRPKSL